MKQLINGGHRDNDASPQPHRVVLPTDWIALSASVEAIFDDHDLATGSSGTLRYVGEDVIQHRGLAS